MVGIGASAGGLKAVQDLLKRLPVDTGLSFALITHLDPKHESRLAEILARSTRLVVQEAISGLVPQKNHLYVIPRGARMVLRKGKLLLSAREPEGGRPSVIDLFFQSLSLECKANAVGVILSGTGSDGVRGLIEIKAQGGTTFAQDGSAQQDGMPKAAIAAGAVDFVLSPAGIAGELTRISRHLCDELAGEGKTDDQLLKLLNYLRRATGVDFTSYKPGTIQRRIARRMLLGRMENIETYLRFLREHPAEVAALHQDLLIKVTSFFRDPDVFAALQKNVLPDILRGRTGEQPVRIWAAGCATGEEVYSLAIGMFEILEESHGHCPIQIFGTDLSDGSIESARTGEYSEAAMTQVSEERKQRFFIRTPSGYQVSKRIRDVCVFAKHDLTRDPPFSAMDLISCRNLLIYLDSSLQKRVFSLFHYALKPSGFLVLGNSETTGSAGDIFAEVDAQNKIFSKKFAPGLSHFDFTMNRPSQPLPAAAKGDGLRGLELSRETERAIAAQLAPNGVIINEDLEILEVRGRVGAFLEPATGQASYNLLKMARTGLVTDLRAAIQKAKKDRISVRKERIRIRTNGHFITAELEVIPLILPSQTKLYAVLFAEAPATQRRKRSARAQSGVEELKQELASTQEYLQSLIDKEQAGNEELKAANEEILSSNEEMQSTNEELETAKEELQSINEELSTLNDELQNRNHQLSVTANDVSNLLLNVRVPLLMLGSDLRIRRITPAAEKVMNVIQGDIGRPLTDLHLSIPDLVPTVREVIEHATAKERVVQGADGKWYSLWARPYQTNERRIDGAVVTLFDVDNVKRASDYANAIVQTIREPLLVLDPQLRVCSANQSFYDMFQVVPLAVEHRSLYALGNGEWDIPELRACLKGVLSTHVPLNDFEVRLSFPTIGPRVLLLNARRVAQGNTEGELILLAVDDITQRKQAEEALKEASNQLVRSNTELEQFAYVASHDLQEPLRTVATYLELLSRSAKLDKDGEEYLNIAANGAKRMKSLVEDILTFSRAGREALQHEPTDCSALVGRILVDLKPALDECRAEVDYGELPIISINPRLLAQVFQNLLTNAVKFRGSKPPEIVISAVQKASEWEFSVADNGIGIEERFQQKIFLIFQRLHGDERPGTGIGLATSKKIVERYGGHMGVESVPGEGSRFWFTLPRREETRNGPNDSIR